MSDIETGFSELGKLRSRVEKLEHSLEMGGSMRSDMYVEQQRLKARVDELEKFIDGMRAMSRFSSPAVTEKVP